MTSAPPTPAPLSPAQALDSAISAYKTTEAQLATDATANGTNQTALDDAKIKAAQMISEAQSAADTTAAAVTNDNAALLANAQGIVAAATALVTSLSVPAPATGSN